MQRIRFMLFRLDPRYLVYTVTKTSSVEPPRLQLAVSMHSSPGLVCPADAYAQLESSARPTSEQ